MLFTVSPSRRNNSGLFQITEDQLIGLVLCDRAVFAKLPKTYHVEYRTRCLRAETAMN
jgi:hypothetical protein